MCNQLFLMSHPGWVGKERVALCSLWKVHDFDSSVLRRLQLVFSSFVFKITNPGSESAIFSSC